jgi:predicted metal-dependent HD superfamily phosphohydrolase
MTWTNIKHTELAAKAYFQIYNNEINGCDYHNVFHIEAMYEYLEQTNEPYDEALDWAVLFHDIVYDALPNKEQRSAEKFVELVKQHNEETKVELLDFITMTSVTAMIFATEDHICSHPAYSAIIRADLHALTNSVQTFYNYDAILQESLTLYRIDEKTFADNNIKFMGELYDRIVKNMDLDSTHREFYKDVKRGIVSTINLSRILKGDL